MSLFCSKPFSGSHVIQRKLQSPLDDSQSPALSDPNAPCNLIYLLVLYNSLILSQQDSPPSVSRTQQACSYFRNFAFLNSSACVVLPGCLHGSPPHILEVIIQMFRSLTGLP